MTPWWVTLLAAVIPSVLSCIVTLFISRKTQINKDSIRSLSTLTAHQADLQSMLQDEIAIVERRCQRLISDVNNLNSQINRLEQENEELREKNKELNQTIQR